MMGAEKTQILSSRRKVFVRDLRLDAFIGVYDEEQGVSQPIVVNFELDVIEPERPISDSLEDVVCYNKMTQGIQAIIARGHIKLVETLAEEIAKLALSHDMVTSVLVKVEKLNAIQSAHSAGVEIFRAKP